MRVLSDLFAAGGGTAVGAARFIRARSLQCAGLALALAIVFIAVALTARQGPTRIESGADAGRAYIAAGDYRSAAETLRAAYRAHPDEALKIDLARALLAVGDYDAVLELFHGDKPQAGKPSPDAYLRAEAMIGSSHYADAETLAQSVLEARPMEGRAMLITARAVYALGDGEGAARWLGKALRARGEALGEAWLFRVRLALDANDLVSAQNAMTRAGEAGAPSRALTLAKTEILMRQGDFDAARHALAALKAPQKNDLPAIDVQKQFLLARIDAADGDYETAGRRVRSIGHLYESEPNGALVASLIAERAGDAAQAESTLRTAIDAAPKNAALLDGLSGFLLRAGRADEAKAVLARLERVAPNTALRRLAALFLNESDYDGGLRAATEAAQSPETPLATAIAFGTKSTAAVNDAASLNGASLIDRAARILADGDTPALREAAVDLQRVGKDPAALALSGNLLLAAGDAAHAADCFDEALAEAPAFAAAKVGRLRAYLAAGESRAAEEWLFSLLKDEPKDSFARLSLARLWRLEGRPLETAAILRPIANSLAKSPATAMLYGNILMKVEARGELAQFAAAAARATPDAAYIADFYLAAGLPAKASLAARDALMRAPGDEALARKYLAMMTDDGRREEATEFLAALLRRAPGAAGARAALLGANGQSAMEDRASAKAPRPLAALRRAYRLAPTDAETASLFGLALKLAGDDARSARLLRESCFWSSAADCPAAPGPGS